MQSTADIHISASTPVPLQQKRYATFLLLALWAMSLTLTAQSEPPPTPFDTSPYIVHASATTWEAWSIAPSPDGPKKQTRPVAIGDEITIPAIGSLPPFQVKLREPAALDPDEAKLRADVPVFVMADTHGQYEIATQLLEKHGVIDAALKWQFGKGRLVVLGDVFDRGPYSSEILWLLYKLEAEAAAAGGRVYFVLGNHECMELLGDLRYVHPRYFETAKVLGAASYAELWGRDTLLGQWLRAKPAVLKLGRTLFVHGGLSARTVADKWSLADLNRTVRARLDGEIGKDDAKWKFVYGTLGPLWYRGYFPDMPKLVQATPAEVERVRKFHGVDRIVVGHTIVPHVVSLYAGKVIAVDVNMERDALGDAVGEGLLMARGRLFRADLEGQRESLAVTAPARASR